MRKYRLRVSFKHTLQALPKEKKKKKRCRTIRHPVSLDQTRRKAKGGENGEEGSATSMYSPLGKTWESRLMYRQLRHLDGYKLRGGGGGGGKTKRVKKKGLGQPGEREEEIRLSSRGSTWTRMVGRWNAQLTCNSLSKLRSLATVITPPPTSLGRMLPRGIIDGLAKRTLERPASLSWNFLSCASFLDNQYFLAFDGKIEMLAASSVERNKYFFFIHTLERSQREATAREE